MENKGEQMRTNEKKGGKKEKLVIPFMYSMLRPWAWMVCTKVASCFTLTFKIASPTNKPPVWSAKGQRAKVK